jgi:predicted ester cyclase
MSATTERPTTNHTDGTDGTDGTDRTDRTDPLTVMRRMFDEGFATGDTAVVDELCSPDLVEHQFGLAGVGPDAIRHVKDAIRDVHAAVPDMSFTIADAVRCGDTIWVRARGRGTATGPFFGPPSGRPVEVAVVDIARVVDGRIVEHWGVPDRFALLAQTGVLDRLR